MYYRYSIAVCACLLAVRITLAPEPSPKLPCSEDLIYLTDHPELLERTIREREPLYAPGMREQWEDAEAEFERTAEGEEVLRIRGLEVMRGFEKPYMASIARTAAAAGGKILNVGYGLGFIDAEIERLRGEFPIGEHHIIELNKAVAARASAWRLTQPNPENIFVHQGDWTELLSALTGQGIVFDAIAYDAFPLDPQELHRDFIPFLEEVIRSRAIRAETGRITFYMDSPDGFGARFTDFAYRLGVGILSTERVLVTLPSAGNQYWERDFFFTPTLTGIRYGG